MELSPHYNHIVTANLQVNIMIAYEIVFNRYPNFLQDNKNFESFTSIGSQYCVCCQLNLDDEYFSD